MIFSSLTFLYCFLPICMALYFLVPGKGKNAVLLLMSLAFYGWGEPKYLLLLAVTVAFFYVCGLQLEKRPTKGFLALTVAGGLLSLGVFKYADFFLGSFASVTGLPVPLLRLGLPMGISFYTFQCISYAVDVYRGSVKAQRSALNFACYVALFPQLVAGPIVRYSDIARELEQRRTGWEDAYAGMLRFCVGLGKKVLLADGLGELVKAAGSCSASSLAAWLAAVGFMLQIYFDFSGYSDMAIGLGRIFGFHFCENFNYPYCSRSITEFWRRWHMSLSYWFRDYVYIPLGGSRVSRAKWVRNILVVWMLTGLWHGAGWNFVLWGLFYAALLLLEKAVPKLKTLPAPLAHGYVLLLTCFGFVIFEGESFRGVTESISRLLFLGVPAWDGESLYLLQKYLTLLIFSAIGAAPVGKLAAKPLSRRPLAAAVLAAAVVLAATAALVSGSYSPFLYFRF